jgi:hypothetical protein
MGDWDATGSESMAQGVRVLSWTTYSSLGVHAASAKRRVHFGHEAKRLSMTSFESTSRLSELKSRQDDKDA